MGWSEALAGVAGGLTEGAKTQQFYAGLENKKSIQQLHDDVLQALEAMKQQGATQRTTATNTSRETVAGDNNTSRENVAGMNNTSRETVAGMNNTSREGIADENRNADLEKYWGGTNPLAWANYSLKGDIADRASKDRRYGIDTGAATSRDNADLASRTSQRNTNVASGDRRAAAKARASTGLFGDTTNVDFLAPPAGTSDVAPVARPPVPVAPRGGAPVRPPAAIGGPPPPAAATPGAPAGAGGKVLKQPDGSYKLPDGRSATFPNDAALQKFLQLSGLSLGQ